MWDKYFMFKEAFFIQTTQRPSAPVIVFRLVIGVHDVHSNYLKKARICSLTRASHPLHHEKADASPVHIPKLALAP